MFEDHPGQREFKVTTWQPSQNRTYYLKNIPQYIAHSVRFGIIFSHLFVCLYYIFLYFCLLLYILKQTTLFAKDARSSSTLRKQVQG